MAKRGRPPKSSVVEEEVIENANVIEDTEDVAEDIAEENTSDVKEMMGNFNPLQEQVVERDYSTPELAQDGVIDIPEPIFTPPNYESIIADEQMEEFEKQQELARDNQDATRGFRNAAAEKEEPLNPKMGKMTPKDKQKSAEAMVDMVLNAYEGLHGVAQKWLQVSEDEMMQLQIKGEIDMAEFVPLADGSVINVGTFFNNYNEQVVEALEFDPKFKEDVRPYMIRVFAKKGWGFSDEQYLMYMFGQDILLKSTMIFQLKSTMTASIKMFAEARIDKYGGTPPPVAEPTAPVFKKEEEDFEDLEDNSLDEVITESEEDVLDDEQDMSDIETNKMSMPEENPLAKKVKNRKSGVKVKNK